MTSAYGVPEVGTVLQRGLHGLDCLFVRNLAGHGKISGTR